MKRFLLDVNVLIALMDPLHVHHERSHEWFAGRHGREWLSCPTTQNGVLRIVAHSRYPNHQPLQVVKDSLRSLLRTEGHRFIADSFSLLAETDGPINPDLLHSSAHITDTYLLGLAISNDASLATFDRQLRTDAVHGGAAALTVIR